MRTEKDFPNGFDAWQETHFEMAQAITIEHMKKSPQGVVLERHLAEGHCGLYNLATELADEFELKHSKIVWDGNFFDAIEKFLKDKL